MPTYAISVFIESLLGLIGLGRPRPTSETLEQRIARLTTALSEAVTLISSIEAEINRRKALVTQLQSDIDTYNQVVSLKASEVEAVSQMLRGELKRSSAVALTQNIILGVVFFALGVGATVLLALFV